MRILRNKRTVHPIRYSTYSYYYYPGCTVLIPYTVGLIRCNRLFKYARKPVPPGNKAHVLRCTRQQRLKSQECCPMTEHFRFHPNILTPDTYNMYNDRTALNIDHDSREIRNLSTKRSKQKPNYRSPSLYYE